MPYYKTNLKLENLKFLEIMINKRSEYPSVTVLVVVVVVRVVGSVTGGVGAGTTSRRCFGRLDQVRTHQGRVGNGQGRGI
jgi:hypothetical protein